MATASKINLEKIKVKCKIRKKKTKLIQYTQIRSNGKSKMQSNGITENKRTRNHRSTTNKRKTTTNVEIERNRTKKFYSLFLKLICDSFVYFIKSELHSCTLHSLS